MGPSAAGRACAREDWGWEHVSRDARGEWTGVGKGNREGNWACKGAGEQAWPRGWRQARVGGLVKAAGAYPLGEPGRARTCGLGMAATGCGPVGVSTWGLI
ncbi:hypothetical protein FS749_007079 [Ceratobasidium sp. UAMH 11750]|nr:hypothetical protein FS749_007079 [Ceratobasidium sp. UAMH 11750]